MEILSDEINKLHYTNHSVTSVCKWNTEDITGMQLCVSLMNSHLDIIDINATLKVSFVWPFRSQVADFNVKYI